MRYAMRQWEQVSLSEHTFSPSFRTLSTATATPFFCWYTKPRKGERADARVNLALVDLSSNESLRRDGWTAGAGLDRSSTSIDATPARDNDQGPMGPESDCCTWGERMNTEPSKLRS